MSKPFYMKLNWGHYSGDTGHLHTAAEHGAYLLLLRAVWMAGGRLKANTHAMLARHACCTPDEWAQLRPVVMPFFGYTGGVLTHKRVTAELSEIVDGSKKRAEAGAKGGLASGESRRKTRLLDEAKASSAVAADEANATKTESESQTEDPEPKGSVARRSRRCPPAWNPSGDTLAWASGDQDLPGETVSAELDAFRDFEFPRPYQDWDATFRNWLRRAAKNRNPGDRHVRQSPGRADARQSARHANLAAALSGAEIAARRGGGDD